MMCDMKYCDVLGTKKYRADAGFWFYLCANCSRTFSLGQANHAKIIEWIDVTDLENQLLQISERARL